MARRPRSPPSAPKTSHRGWADQPAIFKRRDGVFRDVIRGTRKEFRIRVKRNSSLSLFRVSAPVCTEMPRRCLRAAAHSRKNGQVIITARNQRAHHRENFFPAKGTINQIASSNCFVFLLLSTFLFFLKNRCLRERRFVNLRLSRRDFANEGLKSRDGLHDNGISIYEDSRLYITYITVIHKQASLIFFLILLLRLLSPRKYF